VSLDSMKHDPGLGYALRSVHNDETALVAQLIRLRDQHHDEHEIHHVTRDLLAWSHDNLAQIVQVATRHQVQLSLSAGPAAGTLTPQPATVAAESSAVSLRLLEDLRTTYLLASAASLSWELVAQHAKARRQSDVLELTGRCHPRTLRQLRWANTMLKTQSPQALTSL